MKKRIQNSKDPAAAVPRLDARLELEEQIALRAHEIWHRRGYEHGADLADWFQAEREVLARNQQQLRNFD